MEQRTFQLERADYRLEAPKIVRTWFGIGAGSVILGVVIALWAATLAHGRSIIVDDLLIGFGGWSFVVGCWIVWSSQNGTIQAANRLLQQLHLRGTETVLNVDCRHGLLLVGAAKQVPSGRAIGVELPDVEASAALDNARIEGVSRRVEVRTGTLHDLPVPPGSIDVVIVDFTLSPGMPRDDHYAALGAMVGVLKPGGTLALRVGGGTASYLAALRALGMARIAAAPWTWWTYPAARTITAIKERRQVDSTVARQASRMHGAPSRGEAAPCDMMAAKQPTKEEQ